MGLERVQPKIAGYWPPVLSTVLGLGLGLNCSPSSRSHPNDGAESCESPPTDIYHDRIEPLLNQDTPKTCNQCHLSGVDLSAFVRSTPCETMACLVQDGLVDPASPPDSKILTWIQRATPDSELITDAVIQAEYEGFLQWIAASAACPSACAGASCGTPGAAEKCETPPAPNMPPPEIMGEPDCSDRALEQLFYDDVYAWRARCFPCHFSDQKKADARAPRWIRVEGNCAESSLASYRTITSGDYLNLEDPTQSLLLLKPLAIAAGGVEHGGHDKFDDTSDPAYQSFLQFIQRYADCRR
ncbi:MAG TPA: hypothetical protein VG937_34755 [Polyangiaceae bacterium]|jgi:hypothetical protein|nr:hypothetical protein [Polyangiaceae bacterium]